MKRLNKKRALISTGIILLFIFSLFIIHELTRPTTIDDLDPKDYDDFPDAKYLLVEIQARDPLGVQSLYFSSSHPYKDELVDILLATLRTTPRSKSIQFLEYLWGVAVYDKGKWLNLLNGDYYYDDTEAIKREAVIALGELKDKRAIEPIFTLMFQWEGDKKKSAIFALASLGDPRSIPYLIKIVKKEYDSDGLIKYSGILSFLNADQLEAINHLTEFCEKRNESLNALVALLDNQNPSIVMMVCHKLGDIKAVGAVPELINLFSHDIVYIRVASIVALGKIKDKRALIPLAELRKSSTEEFIKDEIDEAIKAINESEKEQSE
jgi:hypothetical protein